MNPRSPIRVLAFSAIPCLVAFAPPTVRAQSFYVVLKSQNFVQTSSAGAVPDPNGAFGLGVEAASSVTLTLPAGGTLAVPPHVGGDGGFSLDRTFATKAALDAAFPNGTYRLTGAGIPTLSFNLTTDAYPTDTPQVVGGTWNAGGLLVVDPAQAATITFSTNSSYAAAGVVGHMGFNLNSRMDNVELSNEIVTQPLFGLTAATTPFTSFTIPAGQLTSGRVYEGELSFDTVTAVDSTTLPGSGVVSIFSKTLHFLVAAQAAGTSTPPPVLVNQPGNQTGALGGSITFNFGITVGGSAPLNNLARIFRFNGREFDLDGTKYVFSGTGYGFTINNLTAADAGEYSATFVTAGGIVNSAPFNLFVAPAAAPAIARQPASQTISQGSTAVFAVGVTAVPAATIQWRLNGVNVPTTTLGANGAVLVILNAGPAQAGTYTAVITNSAGSVTTTPATLTLSTTNDPGRLINLSILTPLAVGETMTMGTVLGGSGTSGTKALLARAAGPSLAQLGVADFLPDPKMTLVRTSVTPSVNVATNDDWGGAAPLRDAFAQAGAFAYAAANSKDAALFQSGASALSPGNYTVQVSDAGTASGTVIAELYDATPAGAFTSATPRLVNVSVLKQIDAGKSLTVGFYVGGTTAKTVLIRAVGPTLGLPPFNIGAAMPDPQLTLFNSSQAPVFANDNWSGSPAVVNSSARVGAFALSTPTSRDAALVITLASGGYTVNVGPVTGSAGGIAIVEVYEVP